MKQFYLLFIFISTSILSYGQLHKKVYFLGNSYTYYNNLPSLIQKTAQSMGDVLEYDSTTGPGLSLQDHMYNPAVTTKLNSKAWDYVILQDQSQRPALDDNYTFPYAAILNDRIKNSSPCAKTLFYMTWGYKEGDKTNCNRGLTHMCTYETMDDRIYDTYMRLAIANKAHVSPVGRVWRKIRQQYPAYELYDADKSHPSLLGSMAAAYTFYTLIYKKDPTTISFNTGLTTEQARNIKRLVKELVYDDLEQWFVGVHYTNKATFEFETMDAPTVTFTNTTAAFEQVHWDFGDGKTSNETNPVHVYEQTGVFTVTLTVTSCSETYTKQAVVTIETLSTLKFGNTNFSIYPNPTHDYLLIQTELEATFQVYDLTGKKLHPVISSQNGFYQLDVRHLARGTYLLQIETLNGQEKYRFVRK